MEEAVKKGAKYPDVGRKTPEGNAPKSEKLTSQERKAFKKWVSTFPFQYKAVEALGITHLTFRTVFRTGIGAPATIAKVRANIN